MTSAETSAGTSDLVVRPGAPADLRAVALAAGMRPLLDDGLAKAARGVTDLREVAGALSV